MVKKFEVKRMTFPCYMMLARIIEKIDVKDVIEYVTEGRKSGAVMTEEEKASLITDKGVDLVLKCLSIHRAEAEIYKLIAKLCGLKPREVEEFELSHIKEFVKLFFEANDLEDLKGFLKSV